MREALRNTGVMGILGAGGLVPAWSQAPAHTPARVLTEPALVPLDAINSAHTSWMLVATVLVLLMTLPGIALFYAGMVRSKNVLNTMACVVVVAALDYAGGAVVHVNAGMSGLACAWVLGRRRGYGKEPFAPYNLGWTMMGAALLWMGWFGFNAGSALVADGRTGLALLVTHVAASAGALGWMAGEWLLRGRASLLGLCSGLVAGLVAITPSAGVVTPRAALAIGLVAGLVCYWGATGLKRFLHADDSLDVFGVHGIGGVLGSLLTGAFASRTISGVEGSVLTQAVGVSVVMIFSLVGTVVLLRITGLIVELRVDEASEYDGLDIAEHREHLSN